ncbi:hypothetical protein [Demequina salsinemoris]|uniref:hypothetical protein n=1 Tax=Demequina salsinemoris TaxID=577470 RepID=UPI000785338B|nr:hypothetical protein [Demequina salsinemoris]
MSTGDEVDFHDAWERTLAELEIDVAEAERLLASNHRDVALRAKPWTPPPLPPLPASMIERARTLLARQIEVSEQLADAARASRREHRAVMRMKAEQAARPVYIDLPA